MKKNEKGFTLIELIVVKFKHHIQPAIFHIERSIAELLNIFSVLAGSGDS